MNPHERAATLIRSAEVFFVATGAGFSADSGLPVYGDIANHPVYRARGDTYADVCSHNTLEADPSYFYGFFGHMINQYKETKPHEGYQLLKQWKESKEKENFYKDFRTSLLEKMKEIAKDYPSFGKEMLQHTPGPFFTYTSNVDGHFRSCGFDEGEIEEMHGSIDFWQCGSPAKCSTSIEEGLWWWLPKSHRFDIVEETMLATNDETKLIDMPSKVPRSSGFYREKEEEETKYSFLNNQPLCISCGGKARPNIVMFNDTHYIDGPQTSHYLAWEDVVSEFVNKSNTKVVILEIGCGMTVPSIRVHTEDLLKKWNSATLIRINPDEVNITFIETNEDHTNRYIGIQEKGLNALKEINKYM